MKRPTPPATAGQYILAERRKRKLTQLQAAFQLGMHPAYLCSIERGRKPVSKNMARLFAQRWGLSAARLIEAEQ